MYTTVKQKSYIYPENVDSLRVLAHSKVKCLRDYIIVLIMIKTK